MALLISLEDALYTSLETLSPFQQELIDYFVLNPSCRRSECSYSHFKRQSLHAATMKNEQLKQALADALLTLKTSLTSNGITKCADIV